MGLNDATISSLIDAARIGIIAIINDVVSSKLSLFWNSKKVNWIEDYLPNIRDAKLQSIQQMVNITANNISMSFNEITTVSDVVPNCNEKNMEQKLMQISNYDKKVNDVYDMYNFCFFLVIVK
jgi:hypothetical protein